MPGTYHYNRHYYVRHAQSKLSKAIKLSSCTTQCSGTIFVHASSKPLIKQILINKTRKLLVKSGFKALNYGSHSYRIGVATMAAKAKLPSWLIKTLGRWSSNCYEQYITTLTTTLSVVSAMLANTSFL